MIETNEPLGLEAMVLAFLVVVKKLFAFDYLIIIIIINLLKLSCYRCCCFDCRHCRVNELLIKFLLIDCSVAIEEEEVEDATAFGRTRRTSAKSVGWYDSVLAEVAVAAAAAALGLNLIINKKTELRGWQGWSPENGENPILKVRKSTNSNN